MMYMTQQACGMKQTIHIDGARKAGTHTLHIFAQTRDLVNGKYLRYDGYIKVTVPQVPVLAPDWGVGANPAYVTRTAQGMVEKITILVSVTRQGGFSGSPSNYFASGSQDCYSESFVPESGAYLWTCYTHSQTQNYTVSFTFQIGATSRSTSVPVNY
jgi:hypothetical protein